MKTVLMFLAVGLALAFVFRKLKDRTIRRAASFKLYSVRDELICLVAEKKLSEGSPVFQYYYSRINHLLKLAPHVGLDNAMDAFLYQKKGKSFESSLKEANRRAEKMLDLVASENEEVSRVVADFYAASKYMILAHSSLFRMTYILLIKLPFIKVTEIAFPKNTYYEEALKTVNFAECEENRFRNIFPKHNHRPA